MMNRGFYDNGYNLVRPAHQLNQGNSTNRSRWRRHAAGVGNQLLDNAFYRTESEIRQEPAGASNKGSSIMIITLRNGFALPGDFAAGLDT